MIINLLDNGSEKFLEGNTYCIIGTGIAGYEVARVLSLNPANRIVMLESGEVELIPEYQVFNQQIESAKTTRMSKYTPLNAVSALTRVRQLGGTLNIWSGRWKPLEQHDFKTKSWDSLLQWPITYDDLLPYYNTVIKEYGLSETGYTDFLTPVKVNGLKFTPFFQDCSPLRLYSRLKELSNKSNVHIVYNASVSDFNIDETGRVKEVLIKSVDSRTYTLQAPNYILATGGIENARILLNTLAVADRLPVLGRYYMDHPAGEIAAVTPYSSFMDQHYPNCSTSSVRFRKYFGLTNKVSDTFCLPNHSCFVYPMDQNLAHYQQNLKSTYKSGLLKIRKSAYKLINKQLRITFNLEQLPSYNSRILLADETDVLGIKKAVLNWTFTSEEQEKLLKYLFILKEKIKDVYDCKLIYNEKDVHINRMNDANHHMGTTRMGINSLESVVDSDCKVHGIQNLFIAGSSVFCTSGNANPTFTITALANRLGTHLSKINL